jgi:molecular chaperone DnaK
MIKKAPIESALEELKKAHESKNLDAIDKSLEAINEAWKNASEEMYKAQAEAGNANKDGADPTPSEESKGGDDVQDVDFEEVKE